jgi:TonB family protein
MRTTTHWLPAVAAAAALCIAAGRARADAIVPADRVDRIPVVVSQETPVYPFSLRLTGNKGEVVVDFIIDPDGNVVSADVSRSSHPDFEAPAVEAVLKWKFKPGMKDGHPVYVHMKVPIYFQLNMGMQDERLPDRLRGGVDPWVVPERAPKDAPPDFQYDEAPKPLLTSAPVYPYDLLVRKVKGKASVTFVVDTLGRPRVVKVMSASLPEFGAATTAMIEAWKFEPARKKGVPCMAILRKDQVFELDAEDFPVNDSAERLLRALRRTPCPGRARFGARRQRQGRGGHRLHRGPRRARPAAPGDLGNKPRIWVGGGHRRGALAVHNALQERAGGGRPGEGSGGLFAPESGRQGVLTRQGDSGGPGRGPGRRLKMAKIASFLPKKPSRGQGFSEQNFPFISVP